MGAIRICISCGSPFEPATGKQVFCDGECRKEYYKNLHQPKRKQKLTLAEINDAAREAGMNYGRYVQKMGL